MEVKFITSYPKLEGGKIKLNKDKEPIISFKYRWEGTPEELIEYEKVQGEHFRKDDKGPLYFSPFYIGQKAELHISTNGKLYADTSLIDAANSMIKQYGKVGEIMAKDLLKNGFSSPRESHDVAEVKDTDPIDS